MVGANLVKGK
jgi:hypothetical protein